MNYSGSGILVPDEGRKIRGARNHNAIKHLIPFVNGTCPYKVCGLYVYGRIFQRQPIGPKNDVLINIVGGITDCLRRISWGTVMTIRRMIFASAAAFALSMLAGAANAVTITIGIQQDAGPISTGSCVDTGAICTFGDASTSVSAAGSPPNPSSNLLGTTALNFSSSGSGTLTVYVTASNISAPLGNLTFTSAFTSTLLPAGWSVTETTLLSTSNQLFAGSTLSTHTFTSIDTFTGVFDANPGSGPYSVTALYSINTNGAGTGLSTIAISAVPGPIVGAGLPGLIIACGSLLALARRRRKVAV